MSPPIEIAVNLAKLDDKHVNLVKVDAKGLRIDALEKGACPSCTKETALPSLDVLSDLPTSPLVVLHQILDQASHMGGPIVTRYLGEITVATMALGERDYEIPAWLGHPVVGLIQWMPDHENRVLAICDLGATAAPRYPARDGERGGGCEEPELRQVPARV
jgi:hypothetical protein